MAMRPRGGAQIPRSQFVVRPKYEYFEPEYDVKEEPTSYILCIYLPGFSSEQLKVTYVASARKIKARGERPLGNYKFSRFEKEYIIPENCTMSHIKGEFDENILMITMPKKDVNAQVAPQQSTSVRAPPQPKTIEEAIGATSPIQKPNEDKPESKSQKGQQDFFQKPTLASDHGEKESDKKTASSSKTTSPKKGNVESKPEKGQQDSSQKPTSTGDHDEKASDKKTSPPKATSLEKGNVESKPEKGQQDSSQKPTFDSEHGEKENDKAASPPKTTSPKKKNVESKLEKGQQDFFHKPTFVGDHGEKESKKTTSPPKATSPKKGNVESKSQKSQQDFSQKPTSASDHGEKESNKNTASPPKATSPKKGNVESKTEKGQQYSSQKPTSTGDLGEKESNKTTSPPEATSPEKGNAESKPEKDQQDSSHNPPKHTAKQAHESVTQKTHQQDNGKKTKEPAIAETTTQDHSMKKMEKIEMSGSENSEKVQDVAAYAKEVMGKLTKRLKEEDESKQLLINAGVAAMVIVAMVTYIAYTITNN